MRSEWAILGALVIAGTLFFASPPLTAEEPPQVEGEFMALWSLHSELALAYNGACHGTCLTCSGPGNKECLACNSTSRFPYLNTDFSCINRCGNYSITEPGVGKRCVDTCPTNTYSDRASKQCGNCDTSCLTCTGPSRANCASCNTTGTAPYMTYDKKCLDDCLPLTFRYTYDDGFMECKLTCMGGLFNNGTDRFCHKCHPACAECNNPKETDCKGCYRTGTHPFLYQGKCLVTCPANTYKFDNPLNGGKECKDTCGDGFFFDEVSSYCVACARGCKTCNNPTSCLTCKPSYPYFSDGQCLTTCPAGSFNYIDATGKKECRATCGDGYVFKSDTNVCYSCDSTCLTCSDRGANNCLSCNPAGANPIFSANACIKNCPAGTFEYNTANGYRVCRTTCGDGFTVTGTNQCVDCHSSCATCSSTSDCVTCSQSGVTLYFNGGLCEQTCPATMYKFEDQGMNKCVRDCGPGFWVDTATKTCWKCNPNCVTCSGRRENDCLSCSGTRPYLYQSQCLAQCPDGLHVSGSTCVATCTAGQGLDPASNTCQPCNSACKTCSDPATCTSCEWGGATPYLSGASCVTACPPEAFHYQNGRGLGECIATCGDGFYLNSATTTCYRCPSTCKTCDASQTCLTCDTTGQNPYLYQGTCKVSCAAPTHYYCGTDSKSCVDTCPASTFLDSTSNYCVQCHAACLSCRSAAADGCLSCDQSGATPYLSNGECLADCRQGTYKHDNSAGFKECISTCGTHYVLDTAANYCYDCHASCLECVSVLSTGCKSCEKAGPTRFFAKGECLAQCPAGTFAHSNSAGFQECLDTCGDGFVVVPGTNVCMDCHNSCATCSGMDATSCTSCSATGPTPYQYSSQCVRACPAGFYSQTTTARLKECVQTCGTGFFLQPATSDCIACHSTCLKCVGPTRFECSHCDQNGSFPYYYIGECLSDCNPGDHYSTTPEGGKECVGTCKDGEAFDSQRNACVKCHPSCSTCTKPIDTDCITCAPTKPFWAAGRCLETCPGASVKYTDSTGWKECLESCGPGYYIGTDDYCRKCHSTCQTCTAGGKNSCTTCNPSSHSPFFVNGECLADCPQGLFRFEGADGSKTCRSMCGVGYTRDTVTNYCVPCGEHCYSCEAANLAKCTSCDYDSAFPFLVNSQCKAFCPAGLKHFDDVQTRTKSCVQTCGEGHYLNAADDYCRPCSSTCLTCSGPGPADCLKCNEVSDTRFMLDGQCLVDCPNGFRRYHNVTAGVFECRSKCGPGLAFNNNTKFCESCHSSCKDCFGLTETECLSCHTYGELPYEFDGRCLSDCGADYYHVIRPDGSKACATACGAGYALSPGTRDCLPCHETCGNCTEPNAADKCETCSPTSPTPYLTESTCLAQCPANYYSYEWGTCLLCLPSCPSSTLRNEDNTTKSCTNSCSAGKFADSSSQSCRICDRTCRTCSGGDSTMCLFCSDAYPYHALNNTCVQTCDKKLYGLDDIDGKRCVTECPPKMFWHYSGNMKECITECKDGYVVGRRCVSREEGLKWGWWLLIILCALLVIALMVWGGYKLYKRYKKEQKKLRKEEEERKENEDELRNKLLREGSD